MDLPVSQITYHSRRHDNGVLAAYVGSKAKQYQMPSSYTLPSSSKSYLSNIQIVEPPSFSYISSPFPCLKQQQEHSSQQSPLKQKIGVLSHHLKSAIQANNLIQDKYKQNKNKLEQKQVQHLNQVSMLKADLIILQKDYEQQKKRNIASSRLINELRAKLQRSQKEQRKLNLQSQRQNKNVQQLKKQLIQHMVKQQLIQRLNLELNKRNDQIYHLQEQIGSNQNQLNQYESIIKQQQIQLSTLQTQMELIEKTSQQIYSQNVFIKNEKQQQQKRIQELNLRVREICQNSEHLFMQIKDKNIEKQILNQKIDKKELQRVQAQQKVEAILKDLQSYDTKYDELRIVYDIIEQKYRQLSEKHYKLQQENIQIQKNNAQLIRQVQDLQQGINQLKSNYIMQQRKKYQLQGIVKALDQEIVRVSSVNQLIRANDQIDNQQKPTRDFQNRVKTEIFGQKRRCEQDNNYYSNQYKNTEQLRYNYSSDAQNDRISNNQPKQRPSYGQFLSFQPSRPYYSNKYQNLQKNQRRLNTQVDQNSYNNKMLSQKRERINTCMNSQDFTYVNKDRKGQSFYVERDNKRDLDSNYKSQFSGQTHKPGTKHMRHSLDLRQRQHSFSDIQNLRKKQDNHESNRNKKSSTLYNWKPQINNNVGNSQKTILFNKLDSLKMWTKQTVSQNGTQRQALKQVSSKLDYQRNRQVPMQVVIKQKNKGLLQNRKNLFNFNLNNQMIQKNMLKLQKNTSLHSKGTFGLKQELLSNCQAENKFSNVSPMGFQNRQYLKNDINKQNKLNSKVYETRRKTLYGDS